MIDNQAFRNYLAAGIVCNTLWPGVEEVKKEPVAYSYNEDGTLLLTKSEPIPIYE